MAVAKSIAQLVDAVSVAGLELIEISVLSTTVVMTATTLSADGDDNSYNDSASGFVAEGFAANDRVNVSGFTGNVANNIFCAVVTDLTTDKMTIGGSDGNVIVDDAAGESVTITKWETKRCSVEDLIILMLADPDLLTLITDEIADALDALPEYAPDLLVPADIGGTAYTIQDTDRYKCYRLTNAALVEITIPLNATEAVPVGARIRFIVLGAGGMDVLTEDPGITLIEPDGATHAAEFTIVELHKTATDEWALLGNFS